MPFPLLAAALPSVIPAIGKAVDYFVGNAAADRNYNQQKEFAQNSVQWRMADAAKAGVNPLAALGMPGMSFTPSTSSSDFSGMGQDISRAVAAVSGPGQRATMLSAKLADLQLEKASLENDYIRSQIRVNNASVGPPSPIDLVPGVTRPVISGQGDGVKPASATQPTWMGGFKFDPPRGWSAAQDVENEYGDFAQNVYGVVRALAAGGQYANDAIPSILKATKPADDWIWRVANELFGISAAN